MTLASDRERDAAILRLRSAHLEGRIDTEELDERIGRAQAARTRDELAATTADLPARTLEAQPTAGSPRVPGRRRFAERKLIDGTVDEVRQQLLTHVLPPFVRQGFYVHHVKGETIAVENFKRMGSRFSLQLHDAGDHRTLVVAQGNAPLSVRRAISSL